MIASDHLARERICAYFAQPYIEQTISCLYSSNYSLVGCYVPSRIYY